VLFRNLRTLHPKGFQEVLESSPGVALALTTTIEPLEHNTLTPVKELGETGVIADQAVVIPIPAVFSSQDGKKLTHS
jgi:hypothetical protein